MLENKKGAIEMSMTTIIVIVLGVTLLILGLAFVRGIFTKITTISDETFDTAQDQLGGLESVDEFLTINPSNFKLKQGENKAVKVIVANFEDAPISVKGVASVVGGDKDLECSFADTKTSESDTNSIKSGGQKKLALIVLDKKGKIRNTACKVTIQGAPAGEDNTGSIIVNVVSGG